MFLCIDMYKLSDTVCLRSPLTYLCMSWFCGTQSLQNISTASRFFAGTAFNTTVVTQYRQTETGQLDPRSLFGTFDNATADLFSIFPVHKARFGNRTSSAKWPTAPLKEIANEKI